MMMLEPLEGRRLFAVTVSEAYPGFYEIHGDETANVIEASVSMTNETFTLDGTTYTGVNYLSINTYGGDDVVRVFSVDGMGYIGAGVSAGDGNDTIELSIDGGVSGGDGDDIITVTDSYGAVVHGEGGHDQIYVNGWCIDAQILGGPGDDLIDATANFAPLSLTGETGNDTIYGTGGDDYIAGGDGIDALYGGSGNDTFFGAGVGEIVDGGDGYDIIYSEDHEGVINVEEFR